MTKEDVADKARRRVARDADAYREAVVALETARARLTDAMRIAKKAGVRQADILRAADHVWTREHLRQLMRPDGGEEPKP